jgi:predicted RNase H-like nuclease
VPGVRIIGVDCATEPKVTGIALGQLDNDHLTLADARLGGSRDRLRQTLTGWLSTSGPVLLCLDAPLGWPAGLAGGLARHHAGEQLSISPDRMFSRDTDRDVRARLQKRPLEVGADRIARTAHAATALLGDLRAATGFPIPLAWESALADGASAIEVYPAATLTVHGMPASGYKHRSDGIELREAMVGHLERVLTLKADPAALTESADVLDAAVCVLAGADFLRGRSVPPRNPSVAQREGWIWVPDLKID